MSMEMMQQQKNLTYLQGIKDCVPTLLGYISIGFACGIVGVSAHLSLLEIALMASMVYAGASQFIICGMLITASPITSIIVTTFIVNLRNFLLSAALAPHFKKYSLLRNIGIGTLVTDESFGVAINKISNEGPVNARWMNGLNVTAYVTWILSCVAGGLMGSWISDPQAFGMDFALTAMFIALLVLQYESTPAKKSKNLLLIIYVVVAMFGFSFFVSLDMAVILSTVLVAAIGTVSKR